MRTFLAYALPLLTTLTVVYLLATPEYERPTRAFLQDHHFRPWWEIAGFLGLANAVGLVGVHGLAGGARGETAAGAILVAFLVPYWPFESMWSLCLGVPLLLSVLLVHEGA